MVTKEQIDKVVDAIEYLGDTIEKESVHSLKGDSTNWTIADSLEGIALSLDSIAKNLEKIANK